MRYFIDHLATVRPIKAQRGATRLSAATVRRIMTPVKAMLSEAYELNVTPINAGKVRAIVHADEGRRRRTAPKTLTREEIAAVLAQLADRDRQLFYVLARTGLRIGEVLGLKWRDLDQTDDGPVLVVRRQHSRGELRDETKTSAGDRRVAVLPTVAHALIRHRAATEYGADNDPIFPTIVGTHQDDHNVRRRLRPAAKAAGVPRAPPHVFRHSLATELRDAGYDAAIIAKVIGHADENFTRRVYIHTKDSPRFDAIDGDDFAIGAAD